MRERERRSSQAFGSPVSRTAEATCGSGTYARVTEQDSSPDNTWTGNTTGYAPGSYTLQVHARNAGSKAAYEAVKLLGCTLE